MHEPDDVGNVVNYMVSDPVQRTFDDFMLSCIADSGMTIVSRSPLACAMAAP